MKNLKTIIKNARIVTSGNDTKLVNIFIENGLIEKIEDIKETGGNKASKDLSANKDFSRLDGYEGLDKDLTNQAKGQGVRIYDAQGMITLAGGIDVHVHLREPGFEEKETIRTGTRAALRGGYTTLMPMPNLNPHPDCLEAIEKYMDIIKKDALVNVYPTACITRKSLGRELVDMKTIKEKFGIKAFTDDGVGVASEEMMRRAMEEAKKNDSIIVAHTEDMSYRKSNSSVHEGENAKKHGWVGIPSETEYKQVERDLELARKTGAKYHICHMSAKESVEALRRYKKLGADVSGEVTCHHLMLTEDQVIDTNYKMNPPLRTEEDRQALIEGLLDGTIDCIANDHAPHTEEEKKREMARAPFGIVGIETAIPLIYTNFVKAGIFTLEEFQKFISENPAKRFNYTNKGKIQPGYDADIIILSEEEKTIRKEDFLSKGTNTPFEGYKCKGYPAYTFVGGVCKYEKGQIHE